MEAEAVVKEIAKRAKEASKVSAKIPTNKKDEALNAIAKKLFEKKDFLISENQKDLDVAKEKGLSAAMIDRLTLTDKVISDMAQSAIDVAKLKDPVGEIVKMWKRPNGLLVGKMRIPLGVIGIIYESRPNVTLEAASLCIKSGNCVILRGGSEAINSNIAISSVISEALEQTGLPKETVQLVPTTDRAAVLHMLKLEEYIDLIIPRGGEELIRFVVENSKIPVIKHYKGLCHIFVDKDANINMAKRIVLNAKVQRPGVCNALETLLVDKGIANAFLPAVIPLLEEKGVEVRGCKITKEIVPHIKEADEKDWETEYLDLILSIKVVDGLDEAINHIERYSSHHTEAIVTNNYLNAKRFVEEVNSSVVLINASTRFNDGGQLGLGAEMGISTTKLHAFGPMGLEELTTTKFVVWGEGQIRE